MRVRRDDLWLMVRLAAQNVARRPLRAILLGLAVMLGVGTGFASFVAGWSLQAGITVSLSRMGADLVVVPRKTLVNITASLLTVQPTEETIDAGMADILAAIPGVARVAPQTIVRVLVDGRETNVIAFDPDRDFSILPWLEKYRSGSLTTTDLIAGAQAVGSMDPLSRICGTRFDTYGRLRPTRVGPVDESLFMSYAALAKIKVLTPASGIRTGTDPLEASPGTGASAISCTADPPLSRVSAFMLQLRPSARLEDVKFAIGQNPDVRIVEGNTVLTSSRQALNALLVGITLFFLVQLGALVIVVSLLFSAIVQERYREIGLMRAMGARPSQIMTIILAEAAMTTGLGGLAGLGFGATLLLVFARTLGFHFDLLGIPFGWPEPWVLEAAAAAAVLFSVTLGLLGSIGPAWRVRRLEPHVLIQGEAR